MSTSESTRVIDSTKAIYEMCFQGLDLLNAVVGGSAYGGANGGGCLIRPMDFGIAGAMLMRPWNPAAFPLPNESILMTVGKMVYPARVESRVIGEAWVAIILEPETWAQQSADGLQSKLEYYIQNKWVVPWVGGKVLRIACEELRSLNDLIIGSSLAMSLFSGSAGQVGLGPTPPADEMPNGYDRYQWGSPPPSTKQFKYANDLGIELRDGMTLGEVRELISERAPKG